MSNDDEVVIEEDEDDGPGDGWIATFCDISMLLLCFFVLLLSMSSIDAKKFKETFSAVRDTFGGNAMSDIRFAATPAEHDMVQDMIRMRRELMEQQKKTFHEIRTLMSRNAMDNIMSAVLSEGTITLRLPAEAMFEAGTERLSKQGREVLQTLLPMFQKTREQNINVRGYTDDSSVPSGARYKDNWELSALRAVNVLRDLLAGGIEPVRLTATGLGDLNPLAPNTTPENRAMNRRVEFVLERRVGDENK